MKKIYYLVLLIAFSLNAQVSNVTNHFTEPDFQNTYFGENTLQQENGGEIIPFGTPTGNSEEVGSTAGSLSVELSGAAVYNVPISVPKGVNGVEPQISLTYSSLGDIGLAGYGWNISGLSRIGRTAATNYYDGVIDPVDYDALDRFTLDGQRLILKSGTYGADGAEYQTENFSNIKITSHGVSSYGANYGPSYFLVEYPDGSKAYYGKNTYTYSRNEWAIAYWENPQGLRITYTYANPSSTNDLLPETISYGSVGTNTPVNKITFVYNSRQRLEQSYVGGNLIQLTKILKEIQITVNNVGFKNYSLGYDVTSLGYQRLINITEKSGDNSKSYNPIVFSYDNTPETFNYDSILTNLSVSNITYKNSSTVTGDFDGDGKIDFLLYPTIGTDAFKKFWMFNNLSTSLINNAPSYTVSQFHNIYSSNFLTGTSSTGYKLSANPGWNIIYTSGSNLVVSTYGWTPTNPANLHYSKTVAHSLIGGTGSKYYFAGDFNGDGLSDILAVVKSSGASYLVNPDKRLTTINTSLGTLSELINDADKVFVCDFNGDSKSDLMVVKEGKVNVYSLSGTNNQIIQLTSYTHSGITTTRPVLIGDYNGDGKTDFIIPKAYGTNYYKYSSKGTTFQPSSVTYQIPYNESLYNSQGCSFVCHIIPCDYNKDGRTDLIYVENQGCDDGDSYIWAKYYKNTGTNFVYTSGVSTDWQSTIGQYAQPIFLGSDKIVSGSEMSFLTKNKIVRITSNQDFSKESLLRTITDARGVKETITYSPLSDTCPTSGCEIAYVPDLGDQNFPNVDIGKNLDHYVVAKLEMQSNDVYKKQYYRYLGAVTNFNGQGFLGFKSVFTTNWHETYSQIVSNISKFDVNKKGILTESYNVDGWGVLASSYTPNSYITKTVNVYQDDLYPNKVRDIKNTSTITYNSLLGTSKQTLTYYDTYSNPGSIYITDKRGSTTDRVHKIVLEYDNQPSGSVYYIGRPVKKNTETYVDAGQINSEEIFNYTNNLLSQVKKKGHNTEYIVEDLEYDVFGNIIEKTISTTGQTPRTVSYEYDSTGRFVNSETDIHGLETQFSYDSVTGLLQSQSNPEGLTTQYFYDVWGKSIKKTNYLGKNTTIVYQNTSDGGFSISSSGENGSYDVSYFDDLGRLIKTGTKTLTGSISFQDFAYDIYNREISVSEPYLSSSSPSLFTTTEYDLYGRVKKVTEPTGKVVTSSFSGLTTTINDGPKTINLTKNSVGNLTYLNDNGEQLSYQYYANNQLKQVSYDGSVTTIEQNGWGQRTKIVDPNAGTFTYEYNNFGDLKKEITPKGQTSNTYDNYGRLVDSYFIGNNGDGGMTSYYHDPNTKLLWSVGYSSGDGNYSHTTELTFDSYLRVTEVKEKSSFYQVGNDIEFKKTYTYDAFGRVDTETSYASAEGETSTMAVKNGYQNGYLFKISDAANSNVLWQATSVNERGQLTSALMGSITQLNQYDSFGFPKEIKYRATVLGTTSDVLKLNTTFDAERGNLLSRSYVSALVNRTETFDYDDFDRLTEYTNILGQQEVQSYDDKGRITHNALGDFEYGNQTKIYQQTAAQLTEIGKSHYYNREGIYNHTMESKHGWITDANITYDTSKFYSGQYSLKVNNTATGEKKVSTTQKVNISNSSATNYTVSGWVYSNGPAAQIHLVMNSAGNTSTDFGSTTVTGSWQYVSKTVSVPANTLSLSVRLDNEGNGIVWFDDIKIVKSDDATAQRKLNVKYNMYARPIEITEEGIDKIGFEYDENNNRVAMFSGSMDSDRFNRPNRKYYSTVATNIEVKHNIVTGDVEFVTYIGGDGYDAPIAYLKKNTSSTGTLLYLFRDYQGSILQISNASGSILESRVFDAWGDIVKITSGTGADLTKMSILDRGYTGHEHLSSVGLINMNARLYDPKLHRFLQPDSYIQNPYNSQNYNRYSYVLNNPLRYTDPSGNNYYGDGPGGGTTETPGYYSGAAEGGLIGSALNTIKENWDDWGIKDWFNNEFSNGVKDATNFVTRNVGSFINDVGNFLGLGGNGPDLYKTTIKTPDFSGINGSGQGSWWSGFKAKYGPGLRKFSGDFIALHLGAANAYISNSFLGYGRVNPEWYGENEGAFRFGLIIGDIASIIGGEVEFEFGLAAQPLGLALAGVSGGAGFVINLAGAGLMVHGVASGFKGFTSLGSDISNYCDYMARRGNNSSGGNRSNQPEGPGPMLRKAKDNVQRGKIKSHDTWRGETHPQWKGAKEYKIPDSPPYSGYRILEKTDGNGNVIYGWTKDHYKTIHIFE